MQGPALGGRPPTAGHLRRQPRRARPRLPADATTSSGRRPPATTTSLGRHPHISIHDEVFVETVGGDLTDQGREQHRDGRASTPSRSTSRQTLADADIEYARVGRADPAEDPAVPGDGVPLPGLQHPDQDGGPPRRHRAGLPAAARGPRASSSPAATTCAPASKTFDTRPTGLEFERVVRSPNGEDVLYVFHARADGLYVLLPYNVIRKEVANPIHCHG